MPPERPLAELASEAARHLREVGRQIVAPSLGRDPGASQWIRSTEVPTEHDERAGQALQRRFSASFPGHGLVIEDREPVPGDGLHEWHIDPIDGSANHLRGIPYLSLSAGLLREGLPVLGVVYDPLADETWLGVTGEGATHGDGRPLSVAPTRNLADAMAIVHIARHGPLMGRPGALERLLWNVRKIRCMGSIALDLALLAGGRADLLVAGRGRPQRLLDVLGGMVVLREAGGVTLCADGQPAQGSSRTLVAGPEPLCRQFVELMADLDLEGFAADQARPPD